MEFSILIAGFGGGVIRGLAGFMKHYYSYKDVKFRLPYFLFTTCIAGVIGVAVAVAVKESGLLVSGLDTLSPALALVVGYAGGDFVENLYKIILKRSS
ncbi:MAG: hypothetical protein HYS52_01670 [Candidatus Wildermuthbacteria bacterium]|nr:hypothetical protein [Candidatus Wildermuthbacteria bacterium]